MNRLCFIMGDRSTSDKSGKYMTSSSSYPCLDVAKKREEIAKENRCELLTAKDDL